MMGTSHNTTAAAWACLRKSMLGVGVVLGCGWMPQMVMAQSDIESAKKKVQPNPKDEVTYDNCTLGPALPLETVVAHEVGEFNDSTMEEGAISGWVKLRHDNAWHCTRYSNGQTVNVPPQGDKPRLWVGLQPEINSTAIKTVTVEGHDYTMYASSSDPQVGYILRHRLYLYNPNSAGSRWLPSQTEWRPVLDGGTPPKGQIRTTEIGADSALYLSSGNTYTVGVESEFMLLKMNKNFPKTGQVIEFELATLRYETEDKVNGRTKPGPPGAPPAQLDARLPRHSRVRVWFNRNDKTCTTPSSQTVDLPTALVNQFSGPGSTAGTKDFTLELTGCSSGISEIQYKLLPSQREITNYPNIRWLTTHAEGKLLLSSGSTATNVAIQVLAKNDSGTFTPVTFDRDTRLSVSSSDYTPGAPTASIPLQARYIQTTADPPTVGDVFATMKVLYMYK